MATNIKLAKQEENLSEANMRKVISMLEADKPCTKKLACETLCISYNVSRLDKLITKFKEEEEFRNRKQAENRGKPATEEEVSYTVQQYMRGNNITQIAKDLFRGVTFISRILDSHDVPRRNKIQNYFKPELIPDSAVRTTFGIGEKVYSARYESLAEIKSLYSSEKENVYCIYLTDERWMQYSYQPASELASLESLTKLGIKI